MFIFQLIKALDSTCSRLHQRLQTSCKAPAISSRHDLKSIGKGNLYLGPLNIIDQILESVMIFIMPLFLTVCQGIPDRGSTAYYGLLQIIVRFLPAYHVLLGPLTLCYVSTKFCFIYQVLSRFSTLKHGRRVVFEPVCANGINRRPTKLLQSLYSEPFVRKHH